MPMSDLISREAAIEALGEYPYNWTDSPEEIAEVDTWFRCKDAIERVPAIDAAPIVHGRWIDYKDEHQCSVCQDFTIVDSYVWANMQFDFCPNCGAKMDEEETNG